jgi:hypothetical protein
MPMLLRGFLIGFAMLAGAVLVVEFMSTVFEERAERYAESVQL